MFRQGRTTFHFNRIIFRLIGKAFRVNRSVFRVSRKAFRLVRMIQNANVFNDFRKNGLETVYTINKPFFLLPANFLLR